MPFRHRLLILAPQDLLDLLLADPPSVSLTLHTLVAQVSVVFMALLRWETILLALLLRELEVPLKRPLLYLLLRH